MGDYDDMTSRLAKALTRHAPHGYDPASDDMTVEFAVKLSEQDAEIARLRAELASRQIDVETFSEASRQLRAELIAQKAEQKYLMGLAAADAENLRAELADESPGMPLGRLNAIAAAAKERGLCTGVEAKPAEVFLIEALDALRAAARQDAEEKARLREALILARKEISDHDSDYHHRTRESTIEAIRAELAYRPQGEAKREPRHGLFHHVTQSEKDMCQFCCEDYACRPQGERSET